MDTLSKILWKFRCLTSGIGTFVGVSSLFLGLILAFWPGILQFDHAIFDKDQYKIIKSQLSPSAISYVHSIIDNENFDAKTFFKSIPASLPTNDRNIIIDLIKYYPNYNNVNQLIILIFLGLLLIIVTFRELTSGRKYRIAHSIQHLHIAVHTIRDNWQQIFRKSNTQHLVDKESAKKYIKESLDEVAKFFSIVTGTPCRVCIKVIVDTESLQVRTFARSKYHRFNSSNDDTCKDTCEDYVYNNSDFKALIGNKNRFWHVQNVNTAANYVNSHVDVTSTEKKSKQLGYHTSFTWPIRKINQDGEPKIYGFLCIDSNVSNAFIEKYDFDSGALIADFYYFLLRAYFKVSALETKEEEQ